MQLAVHVQSSDEILQKKKQKQWTTSSKYQMLKRKKKHEKKDEFDENWILCFEFDLHHLTSSVFVRLSAPSASMQNHLLQSCWYFLPFLLLSIFFFFIWINISFRFIFCSLELECLLALANLLSACAWNKLVYPITIQHSFIYSWYICRIYQANRQILWFGFHRQ